VGVRVAGELVYPREVAGRPPVIWRVTPARSWRPGPVWPGPVSPILAAFRTSATPSSWDPQRSWPSGSC